MKYESLVSFGREVLTNHAYEIREAAKRYASSDEMTAIVENLCLPSWGVFTYVPSACMMPILYGPGFYEGAPCEMMYEWSHIQQAWIPFGPTTFIP